MATKKIPISFNDEDQIKLKELIDLLDLANVYGADPKAIKFSINLAISALKNPEKVYTDLKEDNLRLYFQTVTKAAITKIRRKAADNLIKEGYLSIT